MSDKITIRFVGLKEADLLWRFSHKTFFEAFLARNNASDMELYAAKALTIERITAELENPDSAFYFAMTGNLIVGYIKLNFAGAQTEFQDPDALEIERIYVVGGHQGKGIGQSMLDFTMTIAKQKSLSYIWLGVWDKNEHAIRFYERHGFTVFGSHPFMLGNDEQVDLLMRRNGNLQ